MNDDQIAAPEAPLPSFVDAHLATFQRNNPHCKFSVDDDHLVILNPWGADNCRLSYEMSNVGEIEELNNIAFRPRFDAILHLDANEVEFIFGYLLPKEEPSKSYVDRAFEFHQSGKQFSCRFAAPTKRLFDIAVRVQRAPSDSADVVVPQMRVFRDAQRLDRLPEAAKRYFDARVPVSFYVHPSAPLQEVDLEDVARHINFLAQYYDRRSPLIVIRRLEDEGGHKAVWPRRFCEGSFPRALAVDRIDDFILQLIEVARETSPRFAFVYYYQVIEYAGFYFVDEKARRVLRQCVRDPAMINCPEEKMAELFAVLCDLAHNDEARMRKVVEESCNPGLLWPEIEHDRDFFCTPTEFEGGFALPSLIAKDTTAESWRIMWMPRLFDHLTRIRNCLVHARERRQSNVILPTESNDCKTDRYLPLIARIAEQIALTKS
jgi:hypothetical protein